MTNVHSNMLPIRAAGTQHLIDRTYREGGAYQWVRETLANALEAGATRVEFGIEWQGVAARGVYRRTIIDNGRGMDPEELVAFFGTFGSGGKPIGGLHENFGVGAKTSLMPWNPYGVVVISWQDNEPAMIWIQRDQHTGEYGLRLFRTRDPSTKEFSLEAVIRPFQDRDHGIDWGSVRPPWLKQHGTVIVLLGAEPTADTVEGDPRDGAEGEIKGLASYLNRRMWELPKGAQVTVEELRTRDKRKWPKAPSEEGARTSRRLVLGARHFVTYPAPEFVEGKLGAFGTMMLADGAELDWFLWDGERPQIHSYAAAHGYVAALYKNELYDFSQHHAAFRAFGIAEAAVRARLWLIVRPPLLTDGGAGVFPRTDRNALLQRDAEGAPGPLPWATWAEQFADAMPAPVLEAVKAARATHTATTVDDAWRERLRERFGSRWRAPALTMGGAAAEQGAPSRAPLSQRARVGTGEYEADERAPGEDAPPRAPRTPPQPAEAGGPSPIRRARLSGRIPVFRPVRATDVAPGILAAWSPHDPEHPEGVVLLNVEHPVMAEQIAHWQELYPPHHADEVRADVIAVYGEAAVAKVAHSEHLRALLGPATIEELRSDAALTMALLGLVTEEATISARLSGRFGRQRRVGTGEVKLAANGA